MKRLFYWLTLLFMACVPVLVLAGPQEDALAAVYRWSAAYTANDVDAIVKMYWPDAILLGTVSPVISQGADAIRTYFSIVKGTGNTNTIGEKHVIPVDDNAMLVTGFYGFSNAHQVPPVKRPSRFTMLVTRRGGEWRIAHHHSSPHVEPK